jgi:DUF4097 and DUF4098 domain-containing protein YvlB
MESKVFQLGESPRLIFRSCEGDVRITGWEKDEVELSSRKYDKALNVQEQEGALEISASIALTARVPVETSAVLENCAGHVRASGLNAVHVNTHRGDLSLNQVNMIEITAVHGDVLVREGQSLQVTTLNGDLKAGAVGQKVAIAGAHGDIRLQGATAQLDLREVTGDVSIRDPDGRVDVRDVNGDVKLAGTVQSGQYNLETHGDVIIYLDPTSSVSLDLEAPLGRVASNLELSEVQESAHTLAGDLGAGTAQIKAVAHNGDCRIRQTRAEGERAQARAEAHARRTAERAQRASERAQRTAERLRRKSERMEAKAHRWSIKWSTPQAEAAKQNLEDERLAVLRMLAEGKVNSEQAEALLGALED